MQDGVKEHRGEPRALELWVFGVWALAVLAMLGVIALSIVDTTPDGFPLHPRLAFTLIAVWLGSTVTASLLQGRYERLRPRD